MSSMPSRLSKSFPREARPESQAKRVATLIPLEDSPQKQQQRQQQQQQQKKRDSNAVHENVVTFDTWLMLGLFRKY